MLTNKELQSLANQSSVIEFRDTAGYRSVKFDSIEIMITGNKARSLMNYLEKNHLFNTAISNYHATSVYYANNNSDNKERVSYASISVYLQNFTDKYLRTFFFGAMPYSYAIEHFTKYAPYGYNTQYYYRSDDSDNVFFIRSTENFTLYAWMKKYENNTYKLQVKYTYPNACYFEAIPYIVHIESDDIYKAIKFVKAEIDIMTATTTNDIKDFVRL